MGASLIDTNDVLMWLKKRKECFVNARKVAKKFKISTKMAGHILSKLKQEGYLNIHIKRRGRFIVYKVNRKRINTAFLKRFVSKGRGRSYSPKASLSGSKKGRF